MAITEILTQIDVSGGSVQTPAAVPRTSRNSQSEYRKQLSRSLNGPARPEYEPRDDRAASNADAPASTAAKDRQHRPEPSRSSAVDESRSKRSAGNGSADGKRPVPDRAERPDIGTTEAVNEKAAAGVEAPAETSGDDSQNTDRVLLGLETQIAEASTQDVRLPEPPASISILLHTPSQAEGGSDAEPFSNVSRDLIPPPPNSLLQIVDTQIADEEFVSFPAATEDLGATPAFETQLLTAVVDAEAGPVTAKPNESPLVETAGGTGQQGVGQGPGLAEAIEVLGFPPSAGGGTGSFTQSVSTDAVETTTQAGLTVETFGRQVATAAGRAESLAEGSASEAAQAESTAADAAADDIQWVVSPQGMASGQYESPTGKIAGPLAKPAQDATVELSAVSAKGETNRPGPVSAGRVGPENAGAVQSFSAGVDATTGTERPATADPVEIVDRVSQAIRFASGSSRPLRVRLHPPELGTIQIEVVSRNGGVVARLDVQTPAAHRAILDNISSLHDALAHQGHAIDRIDVHLSNQTRNESSRDFSEPGYSEQQQSGAEQDQPKQQESHGGQTQDHDSAESQYRSPQASPRDQMDQLDIQI